MKCSLCENKVVGWGWCGMHYQRWLKHGDPTVSKRNRYERHGLNRTRLHIIWQHMRRRCNVPSDAAYANYGGRGIKVCEEWESSFLAFHKWATENGYTKDLTIDRIDVNKGYAPNNCRWATRKEQALNKRDSVTLSAFGETKSIEEWLEDERCLVENYSTLYARIKNPNWTAEQALTLPVKGKK